VTNNFAVSFHKAKQVTNFGYPVTKALLNAGLNHEDKRRFKFFLEI